MKRLAPGCFFLAALALADFAFAAAAQAPPPTDQIARAAYRWERSPHGSMLERILPPTVDPRRLPEADSAGARLTVTYCVQCHHLPNPSMHDAAKWQPIVERMVWRMEGKGNLGTLMKEMMGDVRAPSGDEQRTLVAYLQKHAQKAIDTVRYPDLSTPPGQMFSIACSQCHVLPDPKRHTAREWPQVVERMQANMSWANRVIGDPRLRTLPELDTAEIIRYLQRHSRSR